MRAVAVVMALCVASLAGCGESGGDDDGDRSGAPTTESTVAATDESSCTEVTDEAMAELAGAFGTVASDLQQGSAALGQLLVALVPRLEDACGISGTGSALGALIEYFAAEATQPSPSGEVAALVLEGACTEAAAQEISLPTSGSAACVGHGGPIYPGELGFDGTLEDVRIMASGYSMEQHCEDLPDGSRAFRLLDLYLFDAAGDGRFENYDVELVLDAARDVVVRLVPPDPGAPTLQSLATPVDDLWVQVADGEAGILFERIEVAAPDGRTSGAVSGSVDCLTLTPITPSR